MLFCNTGNVFCLDKNGGKSAADGNLEWTFFSFRCISRQILFLFIDLFCQKLHYINFRIV